MLATIKRILVPVDGSATSDKALAAALELARETGASVRLFHSVELAYAAGLDFNGQAMLFLREAGEQILARALASAQSAGVAAESRLLDQPAERLGEAVANVAIR